MKNSTSKFYFGEYGGRYVPETLIPALEETAEAFEKLKNDKNFNAEYRQILKDFVGRETPLFFAPHLSERYKAKIYLKREDLCHTGSHKINNAVGQALLARYMKKKKLIAETGAGQHGVATATVAAYFGFECKIFMGTEDMRRQAINVHRMRLLGSEVQGVDSGSKTLKDAINDAMRYWTLHVSDTHYLFGSVLGPYPFPKMVHFFQKIIGEETKKQILEKEGRFPDYIIACVGGGSNSMGIFSPFIGNKKVKLIGVEAGGKGNKTGQHAARFMHPEKGVLHGTFSYLIQKNGQIQLTHSIAPGLDYASIGPEHAYLHDQGLASYDYITDKQAVFGFKLLSSTEGIIPALESSHAVGYLEKIKDRIKGKCVVINISGRGDKDLFTVEDYKA